MRKMLSLFVNGKIYLVEEDEEWNFFCIFVNSIEKQNTKKLIKIQKDMKVKEVVEALNLKVLSGEQGLDKEVEGCYVSDLLSDVMGNAEMGNIWVTLQTHKNVMAIASLKELAAVILVKGQSASEDTLEQSNEEGIPFLSTEAETFETAGKIYELIKK